MARSDSEPAATTVLVRADASPAIGVGHVVRALAVAEELDAAGIRVLFASAETTPAIEALLERKGFRLIGLPGPVGSGADLTATRTVLSAERCAAVLIDGYRFGVEYRRSLQASGCCVLAWDDLADLPALHANLVVNPAPQACECPYDRIAPAATLLLGPAYAAVRREIRYAAETASARPLTTRRALLLTLGGSDPLGLTEPLLDRLAVQLPDDCRLIVAVGGSNPRAPSIAAAARAYGPRVTVEVDTPKMGSLMAESGLAVSAGGGTTAELAAIGVPVLLVVVADNQELAAREVARRGWGEVVDGRVAGAPGRIAAAAIKLWCEPARRQAMAERAAGLVDGKGAWRIATALLDSIAAQDFMRAGR